MSTNRAKSTEGSPQASHTRGRGFAGKRFGRRPPMIPQPVGKIKFKMMKNFRPRKRDHQRTIFTTHFTTKSPQKNHDFSPQFPKTPCKNATPPRRKKIYSVSQQG